MKPKQEMVAGIINDIRRLFQVLNEQSRKIECETSLTGSQLWAIKILEEESPLKVTELARKMYLHPATMVGLLDRLESKGLVKRVRSEHDRRVVHICLTEQGRETVEGSPEVVQDLLAKGLEVNSEQKLEKIMDGMECIITILGLKDVPPKMIISSVLNLPKRRKKVVEVS